MNRATNMEAERREGRSQQGLQRQSSKGNRKAVTHRRDEYERGESGLRPKRTNNRKTRIVLAVTPEPRKRTRRLKRFHLLS